MRGVSGMDMVILMDMVMVIVVVVVVRITEWFICMFKFCL
jgi:hypothetical protein